MTYHQQIPERNKGEIFTLQCDGNHLFEVVLFFSRQTAAC